MPALRGTGARICRRGRGSGGRSCRVGCRVEFQSLHTYTTDFELDEAVILIAADEVERGENAKLGLMFRATSGGSLAV
jgi:hypothetical protein